MMDWDAHYRSGEYPWDHGQPCPGLEQWLGTHSMSGRILVPGCGRGHDAGLIAQHCPDAEVIGLDISPTAIGMARELYPSANIQFECADIFALPDRLKNSADWVWEHTCFCAIPPGRRSEYASSLESALKAGSGQYLAIFYLNPDITPGSDGPPFGSSQDELNSIFLPFLDEITSWIPSVAYPSRANKEWMRWMKIK